MRKTSFVLLLGLAACGGEEQPAKGPENTAAKVETKPEVAQPTTTAAPETPAAPKATLAELQAKGIAATYEALNAHDAKKLASVYSENATFKSAGNPDVTGQANIEKNLGMLFGSIPDLKAVPNFVFTKGDVTVVQYAVNGTHKGDMGPFKATNKAVGWQAATVQWWNEAGQIKEEHLYWDMNTLLSQIGVSKQKGPAVPTLGTKAEMFTANGSEAETKNLGTLKGFYGAFEKKSATDFLAVWGDASEWHDNTTEKVSKGSKDAKAYFEMNAKGFPDAKVTINNQWGIGDFVVTETTMTGTHKGTFMGIKPTNKAVNLQGVDIALVKDGKLVKGWSFGNSLQAAEQLGLLPKPGGETKPAGEKKPEAPKKAETKPAPKK